MGFTKKETGGSCKSGCHLPKGYDRINPVDYSAPPAVSTEKDTTEKAKDEEKKSDEKKV